MERIIPVQKEGVTYALLFQGKQPVPEGVRFLTKPEDEFQLGVMERPAGHVVKPHTHPRTERRIQGLSEFLYIESGKVRVTVFDDDWQELAKETLQAGEFLIFFRGGHGVEVLENTRMLEVKQGPFLGDANAKTFLPNT